MGRPPRLRATALLGVLAITPSPVFRTHSRQQGPIASIRQRNRDGPDPPRDQGPVCRFVPAAMARFVGVSCSTLAAREEGQVAAPSLVNPQAARRWHSTLGFLALRADLRAESQVRRAQLRAWPLAW